jgi:hypothetical protein
MWESRRDFQGVWEGWEAGFMAFHAFHTLSFPWPVLPGDQINQLRHLAQYTAPATTAYRDRLSMSASAIYHLSRFRRFVKFPDRRLSRSSPLARKTGYSDNESGNRPNAHWSGSPLHGNLVNRA